MKEFIEKHSTYIGIGLIVVCLIGGTLLLVRKGSLAKSQPPQSDQNQKISELENKITDLEAKIAEPKPAAAAPVSEVATSPLPTSKSSQPNGKVNINTANQAQLESLPQIGPTKAQAIIEYRTANGPFTSPDKIQNVKGIGPKTYEKLKDQITI